MPNLRPVKPSLSPGNSDEKLRSARLRLIAEILGNLRSIGMTLICAVVVSIVILYVSEDILDRTIVIKNIAVPDQLQKLGYTSDTVVERLLSDIGTIRESNKFNKILPDLSSTLASPDITIPSIGISLRSLVWPGRHGDVVGELVKHPHSTGKSPPNDDIYELYLTSSDQHQKVSSSDLDDLFMQGAKTILGMVDMFSLAAYLEHRDHDKTVDLVHELLQSGISDGDRKWVYILWGNILVDDSAFDEALDKFNRAKQIDPNLVLAWNGIGIVYEGKGDFPDALKAYTRATAADPKSAYPWNGWGDILLRLNDLDGAIEKYKMSTTLLPQSFTPWMGWGDALVLKGEYEEAIEKYRDAITIDSDAITQWSAWSPWIGWGTALCLLNNTAEAVGKYEQALHLRPGGKFHPPITPDLPMFSNLRMAIADLRSKQDHPGSRCIPIRELVPRSQFVPGALSPPLERRE
jgi:tetratricopeptide (TPR) repeat protein